MARIEIREISPQLTFKLYGTLAIGAGAFGALWGPMFMRTELLGVPLLDAALVRISGSVAVAVGICALQLGRIDDPAAARRSLIWFYVAHLVLIISLTTQQKAVLGSVAVALALHTLEGVALGLLWIPIASSGYMPRPLTTLFSRPDRESTASLRSRYEQEIRDAASQEERNRLARELHDSIKQQIFVIQTAAATAQARFGSDETGARAAIDQVRESARAAIAELEAMLSQLRAEPLGNQGLAEVIRKETEALGFRTGAQVEYRVGTLPANSQLPPGAQRAALRIAQEALANVGRHARASHVTVSLDTLSNRFELKIEDDGQGFDLTAERHGMGLRNMRERAEEFDGTLEVTSRREGGTAISLSLPVSKTEAPRVYLRNALLCAAGAIGCGVAAMFGRLSGVSALAFIFLAYGMQSYTAYQRVRGEQR